MECDMGHIVKSLNIQVAGFWSNSSIVHAVCMLIMCQPLFMVLSSHYCRLIKEISASHTLLNLTCATRKQGFICCQGAVNCPTLLVYRIKSIGGLFFGPSLGSAWIPSHVEILHFQRKHVLSRRCSNLSLTDSAKYEAISQAVNGWRETLAFYGYFAAYRLVTTQLTFAYTYHNRL